VWTASTRWRTCCHPSIHARSEGEELAMAGSGAGGVLASDDWTGRASSFPSCPSRSGRPSGPPGNDAGTILSNPVDIPIWVSAMKPSAMLSQS